MTMYPLPAKVAKVGWLPKGSGFRKQPVLGMLTGAFRQLAKGFPHTHCCRRPSCPCLWAVRFVSVPWSSHHPAQGTFDALQMMSWTRAKGQRCCMQNTLAPLIGWKPWAPLPVYAQKVPGAHLVILFRAPLVHICSIPEGGTGDTPALHFGRPWEPCLAVGQEVLSAVAVFLTFLAHRRCNYMRSFLEFQP